MWCLAARNAYSLLETQELGKPSILDYISQHKAAFKMLLPSQRGKKFVSLYFQQKLSITLPGFHLLPSSHPIFLLKHGGI